MSNLDYITMQGLVKLKQRLEHLNNTERPEIIRQVVTAREMGDLSENAEYHAAREKERMIDKEISHIRRRINQLKVIDTGKLPKDTVRFGAKVKVKEKNKISEYKIVGIDETNFHKDEDVTPISIASPIGRALIGVKVGETVTIKVPKGDIDLQILSIE